MAGVNPVIVDTSSLIAFCKTSFDEVVFSTISMTTTNVCNEEVKRQKGMTDALEHRSACERYLELLRQNKNPDIVHWGDYKHHVENQGEKSLIELLEAYPTMIDYILLFDFDAIERFQQAKVDIGADAANTKISLPNYAFELLRQRGDITQDEYCKATYQMGTAEGWMKRHALKLDDVSSVNCPEFP